MILIATILLVFVVIFMVPVAVYGAVSAATGLMPPGDRPFRFLAGVAVSKLGTAAAFVLIWHLGVGITGAYSFGSSTDEGHERGRVQRHPLPLSLQIGFIP